MNLIPVIDLARGQVVHARGGARESYQPLRSILCRSSEPLDVVTGLLDLHPFTHLYVADLDAIQGQAVQTTVLQQLQYIFPALQMWIDCGIRDSGQIQFLKKLGNVTPVLGSETLPDTSLLEMPGLHDTVVLSLDFMGQSLLGPAELMSMPALWPRRILALALDRVGNQGGADLERLGRIRDAAPAALLYTGGGVRNQDDLHALQAAGCAGVLLASALHNGSLNADQLAGFS